jgi:RHS repeat-associated protein
VSQEEVDARFYAIVTDLIGTPTELFTPDGVLARSTRTTIWGTTTAVGPADCPLRFPGQYHDAESGLHYNHQRYYDPETARYASPDPLGLEGGPDPHAYVANPTGWIDPLGLTPCVGSAENPFQARTDAFSAARDRAGVPRSAQPTQQWTVGDDATRGWQTNYHYDPNPGAHGRYYQYETPQGTRVVAEHTADPNAPYPHFHAGQPKDPARPFMDMKGERYGQVGGKHHIYYGQ